MKKLRHRGTKKLMATHTLVSDEWAFSLRPCDPRAPVSLCYKTWLLHHFLLLKSIYLPCLSIQGENIHFLRIKESYSLLWYKCFYIRQALLQWEDLLNWQKLVGVLKHAVFGVSWLQQCVEPSSELHPLVCGQHKVFSFRGTSVKVGCTSRIYHILHSHPSSSAFRRQGTVHLVMDFAWRKQLLS